VAAASAAESAGPPQISHDPLRCVQAAQFPRVDAGVASTTSLRHTRVYFKAHQHPDWYFVEMRGLDQGQYLALLPQPLPETRQLDYYVHALDVQAQTSQTDTYEPDVAKGRCPLGREVAPWSGPVAIVLFATRAGQSPIPPGFAAQGITAFVTEAGTTLSGSALGGEAPGAGGATGAAGGAVVAGAAASAGGGVSGPLLVAGGVVVAGGAADALVPVMQMQFSATATNLDTSSLTYLWDLGDGTQSADAQPTHRYRQKGTMAVALIVADGNGRQATGNLSVEAKMFDGTWTFGANPFNCTQSGVNVSCLNTVPPATPESSLSFSGALSAPRHFAATWYFVAGSHPCDGDLDETLDHYVCQVPPAYGGETFRVDRQ
jgi:hypothetical protein